jgi:O-antigen/teichoic acid export membrane protein
MQVSELDVLDTATAGPAAVRGGALRVGGYAVGVALSIGSAAALFRHLGVADTGRYVTILTVVALAAGLTDCGLAAIATREAAQSRRGPREVVSKILGLRLVLSLAAAAAATAFSALAGYGSSLVLGAALAGLGFALVSVQGVLAIPLMTSLRFKSVTFVELVRQAASVALILVLVAKGAGVLPFLAVPLVTAVGAVLMTAWLVRREVSFRPSWKIGEWAALLRGFLPYAIATVVTALYFRVALVLTSLVANDNQTGLFGAANRVIDVLILLPGLAVGATLPILARAARDDLDRLAYAVGRIFETCVVLGGGAVVSLVLGAPIVIRVIGGSEFTGAVPVLRIAAGALACAFAGAILGYALLAIRLYGPILVTNAFAFGLASALTLGLVPKFGARGAAVAVTVAEFAIASFGYVFLAVRRPTIAPSLAVLLRVVPAVAVGLLPLLVASEIGDAAATACGITVYVALVLVLRALPDEVSAEFWRGRRLGRT